MVATALHGYTRGTVDLDDLDIGLLRRRRGAKWANVPADVLPAWGPKHACGNRYGELPSDRNNRLDGTYDAKARVEVLEIRRPFEAFAQYFLV